MHSSWFSYAVSRPYPFRWFTPVTIVGGVVLTVVFTIINLASSGFYLKPTFTEDPNSTTTRAAHWFMKAPFNWDDNLETQCQPNMLAVGDRFFTTNLGLQYSIKAITQASNDSKVQKSYPSVPYLNNTLEDCYLTQVDIDLRKSDSRVTPSWWLSWITSFPTATASCTIMSNLGLMNLTLGVEYNGEGDHIYDYVIEDDYKTHASTWWGTRLLNAYFTGILTTMSQTQRTSDGKYWSIGRISYTRNPTKTNIRELSFFNFGGWFLSSNGFINGDSMVVHLHLTRSTRLRIAALNDTAFIRDNPEAEFVPVATEALHFARILHSLVAVDLGNRQAANLLLEEDDLRYAILPPDDPNRQSGGFLNGSNTDGQYARYCRIPAPGSPAPPRDKDLVLLNETYDRFADEMGPLECNNATIVMQYLCSVPQSKSPGVMLLAIVLANLVFLQAAWKILNWVAEGILSESQVATCRGCFNDHSRVITMESLPRDNKAGRSYSGVSNEDGDHSLLITNGDRI